MYKKSFFFLSLIIFMLLSNLYVFAQNNSLGYLKAAGIQVVIPKGWQWASADTNILYTEKGAITMSFFAGDDYDETVSGIKDGLKTTLKDLKSSSNKGVFNSLDCNCENGSGINFGKSVSWQICVFKGGQKPLVEFMFSYTQILDKHRSEANAILNSIGKIQQPNASEFSIAKIDQDLIGMKTVNLNDDKSWTFESNEKRLISMGEISIADNVDGTSSTMVTIDVKTNPVNDPNDIWSGKLILGYTKKNGVWTLFQVFNDGFTQQSK